jgi:uncharacterized protein (DUF433 family)/nucleoside 2-deoxyribosyltransferase
MKKKSKKECFVMMPLSDPQGYNEGHFKKVYEGIIQPACEKAGILPILADKISAGEHVTSILQKLDSADMFIFDISSTNPNILYELGLSRALNKPTVLIQDMVTRPIFDNALNIIQYDNTLKDDTVLKSVDAIAMALKKYDNEAPLGKQKPSVTKKNVKSAKELKTAKTYNMENEKDLTNLVAEDPAGIVKTPIARITMSPAICQGRPTIRNTRYTVELILDLLSSGMTEAEILDDYPALESADIKACLAYASQLSKVKSVNLVVA